MDWDLLFLNALRHSCSTYDDQPDWRAPLALYSGLQPDQARSLDQAVLAMIHEDYRNPHCVKGQAPFDGVLVNLPAGLATEDLICIESAVLVAAERGIGEALFAFRRLMRAPRWHAVYPRLLWLGTQVDTAQQRLSVTRAGRSLGAMLGVGIGDALGSTLEFMSRADVRRRYPEGHRELVGGGPFGFAPGEWTDDTAMTVAVARGVTEAPLAPVEAVGRHFMAWFQGSPPDVGSTCRLALSAYSETGSWEMASERVLAHLGDRAAGNGALMRTLPTAVVFGADVAPALRIARMTHPHPDSDAAVAVYHTAVHALLEGQSKAEAFAAGLWAAGHLADRLAAAPDLAESAVRASGYSVDTLEAALWAFLGTDSFEECLIRAVNLGDDADTVGAVCGGLAGAFYGPLGVPRRWTLALHGRSELEDVAERLARAYVLVRNGSGTL